MQQTTREFGQEKEHQACDYLIKQGLDLVTKNYQCKMGEIDLIMQDKRTLVFVEVRFRNQKNYGGGLESITKNKQRKIIRAAQYYLLTNKKYQENPCRFDVVAIAPQKTDWIKDAFWAAF